MAQYKMDNKRFFRQRPPISECDETPECEHRNTEYHHGNPEMPDEPEHVGGFFCLDCETWLEIEDEATRLGI